MKVVVVAAQKGGVGKTTLAVNLAAIWPGSVLVDADGVQQSAVVWGRRRKEQGLREITVIPADHQKAALAIETAQRAGMERVVIDARPELSEDAVKMLALADLVVLPVEPSVISLDAVTATARLAVTAGKKAAWVINMAHHRHSPRVRELQAALGKLALGKVCPTVLISRVGQADAVGMGMGITEYAPKDKGAAEMLAVARWLNQQL